MNRSKVTKTKVTEHTAQCVLLNSKEKGLERERDPSLAGVAAHNNNSHGAQLRERRNVQNTTLTILHAGAKYAV